MSTSAARPDDLDAYARRGLAATAAWAARQPSLASALEAVRTALRRADPPPELRPAVPLLESAAHELEADLVHLDHWVAAVAAAFRAADDGARRPDGAVRADEAGFVLGWAARADAEQQGRDDADALAALLVPPLALAARPPGTDRRSAVIERLAVLRRVAERVGAHGGDLDYAASLYNRLGAPGTRELLDVLNAAGVVADLGVVDADATFDGLVGPLARAFGDADRAGRLDAPVVVSALDLGAGYDTESPAYLALGLAGRAEADRITDGRRRALAIVLASAQLSSATTAAAASRVLRAATSGPSGAEGFTGAFVSTHPDFATSEVLALRALDADDRALQRYLADRSAGPARTNLVALVEPAYRVVHLVDAVRAPGPTRDDVADRYQQLRVSLLQRGLIELPAVSGAAYGAAATDAAAATMRTVAAVRTTSLLDPEIQRALALLGAPYGRDIATLADPDPAPNLPASRISGVTDAELAGFLEAVSHDEQARHVLLADGAVLLRSTLAARAAAIATGHDDFAMGTAVTVGFFDAVFDAARAAGTTMLRERAAAVHALGFVVSPLLSMVSGALLAPLNVMGPAGMAAARQLARDATVATTKQIADWVVPMPLVPDLRDLGEQIVSRFHDTAMRALFADDAARVALGGPSSLAGLSPAAADAAYRAFAAPSDPTEPSRPGPDAPVAADRVRTLENQFVALSRSALAFDRATG